MPRIISFSIRDEDAAIIDELAKLPGSRSGHICAALIAYLKHKVTAAQAPDWYVAGKDYSYLPVEVRKELEKVGYKENCKGCGRNISIGEECPHL